MVQAANSEAQPQAPNPGTTSGVVLLIGLYFPHDEHACTIYRYSLYTYNDRAMGIIFCVIISCGVPANFSGPLSEWRLLQPPAKTPVGHLCPAQRQDRRASLSDRMNVNRETRRINIPPPSPAIKLIARTNF